MFFGFDYSPSMVVYNKAKEEQKKKMRIYDTVQKKFQNNRQFSAENKVNVRPIKLTESKKPPLGLILLGLLLVFVMFKK